METYAIVIKKWAFETIFAQAQERANKYGWTLIATYDRDESWTHEWCDMALFGTIEQETEKAYKVGVAYINRHDKRGEGFTMWLPKKAVTYLIPEEDYC